MYCIYYIHLSVDKLRQPSLSVLGIFLNTLSSNSLVLKALTSISSLLGRESHFFLFSFLQLLKLYCAVYIDCENQNENQQLRRKGFDESAILLSKGRRFHYIA